MIARALRTKARVICACSNKNVSVFQYFMMSTWAQKAKMTMNFLAFPSVIFAKIWRTGSKYFTLVGAVFQGCLSDQYFRSGKIHKFARIEKSACTNPTFFALFKIHIPQVAMRYENFGRFPRRKLKKITDKAIKKVKNTFVWALIIQDSNPKF